MSVSRPGLARRRSLVALAACLGLATGSCAQQTVKPQTGSDPPAAGASPAVRIVWAAKEWLASLESSERRRTLYDLGDSERFDLRLAPILLEGLRGDRLTDAQWDGMLAILAGGLSQHGLAKVETIMSLEVEVERRDREAGGLRSLARFIRNPRRYYVALFGPPRSEAPFGLRVEGHHLSLNWTVLPDGAVSTTPFFLGSQPRELPFGSLRAGLRTLAEEEDQARALYRSLDPDQRARATLVLELATGLLGRRPMFIGEGPTARPAPPVGLRRADMPPAQADALDALIEVYLTNFAAEIAQERRLAIRAADPNQIHFAWAGEDLPDRPSYYRIQGPTFLIEFDDTVPDADHVHAIYREFEGDFGRDLLRAHYAQMHAPQGAPRQ